ncbi:Leucine-, isoleucine-, valine-, threonine-, and alanine-binding protein [bacterium HR39]|nr:Leucine-, isoleucine-, valine-, threonine-, and alanine-binding protein [bacterium HR39]
MRTWSRRMLPLLAAAVATLWASGGGAQEPIRIGAVIPTTGPLQVYGEATINGLRLAVDEINAAGGVLGRPVELVVADTATNPQVGVEAAKRLVAVEGVVGLIGALSSGVTIPIATTVAKPERIPQISTASTSPVITTLDDDGFLFRTVPSDALQGVVLAQLVAEQGFRRVAVIYVNNDYGRGLAEAFAGAFTGEVSAMVAYEERQASYRGELQRASRGDPEALVLIAYPGDGIPILRQALEEGFFSKFIFTDGMKAQDVVDAIGAPLEGAFGTAPTGDPESPAARRFRELYEARYGELPPQPFIDSAYDAMMLMALAIQKAGSTDGTAIRDALPVVANPPGEKVIPGEFAKARAILEAGGDVDYEGAAGNQNFDEHGDVPGIYSHWAIRDGKIVEVAVIRP